MMCLHWLPLIACGQLQVGTLLMWTVYIFPVVPASSTVSSGHSDVPPLLRSITNILVRIQHQQKKKEEMLYFKDCSCLPLGHGTLMYGHVSPGRRRTIPFVRKVSTSSPYLGLSRLTFSVFFLLSHS